MRLGSAFYATGVAPVDGRSHSREAGYMTDRPPTHLETARTELRAKGVELTMHPGMWCVNFRGAGAETAYFSEDLEDVIEHGREMAASAFAVSSQRAHHAKPHHPWHPKKMTPKAIRRRMIRAHNRRMRARLLRRQREPGEK